MTTRILIVLNLIGCLFLSSIVVVYWKRERGFTQQLERSQRDVVVMSAKLDVSRKEAAALNEDIDALKQSLQSLEEQRAMLQSELIVRQQRLAEVREGLEGQLKAQQARWEKALAERDERIVELQQQLVEVVKGYDEAVARLKSLQNR